jgi:hypothetical protein
VWGASGECGVQVEPIYLMLLEQEVVLELVSFISHGSKINKNLFRFLLKFNKLKQKMKKL